jgi:hypothetical protein
MEYDLPVVEIKKFFVKTFNLKKYYDKLQNVYNLRNILGIWNKVHVFL